MRIATIGLAASAASCATVPALVERAADEPVWVAGALEAASWNGVVLRAPDGTALGARFACVMDGRLVDTDAVFHAVTDVGPHAPDSSYAALAWDPALPVRAGDREANRKAPLVDRAGRRGEGDAMLEWSRTGGAEIEGRFRAPPGCRIVVTAYAPWRRTAKVTPATDGRSASLGRLALALSEKLAAEAGTGGGVTLTAPAETRTVAFRLAAAEPRNVEPGAVAATLEAKRRDALAREPRTDGTLAGAAEALGRNLMWMVLARPDTGRLYVPAGRRWIFAQESGEPEDWTIFEWDGFFNALELSAVSPELSRSMLRAVLETQYPNGNMPNFRSATRGSADRSQPPIGSFCVLKLWERLGRDRAILEEAYPKLLAWHKWWLAAGADGKPRRDANRNGLLEWGTDLDVPDWEKGPSPYDKARYESGMDDSPLWDGVKMTGGHMMLDAVDLSALYALDAWCLAEMARVLGRQDEADVLRLEWKAMGDRINDSFWNDAAGFYFDRHFDGRASHRKAASSFYPLLAGVAPPDRARRVVAHLRDGAEFWGEFMLPTISRDDPAFGDQQYWRGTIWPPTNYLVVHALRRAGFEAEASALASAGAKLFLESWRRHGLCRENYDSRTGEGGGHRFQSWGPLFVLAALEDFVDVVPGEGLRLGSFEPAASRTERLWVAGRSWTVERAGDGQRFVRDGTLFIRTDGPAVVSHIEENGNRLSFVVEAPRPTRIEVAGSWKAATTRVTPGGTTEIAVPAGQTRWRLDR